LPHALHILAFAVDADEAGRLRQELAADPTCRSTSAAGVAGLRAAVADDPPDVILAVDAGPDDVRAVLQVAGPATPVVVLGGPVGEEAVAELFRAGASDFVARGNANRLASAARRAAEVRPRRQGAAATDTADLALLAAIVESSEEAIVCADPDGVILAWNPAAERLFGWSAAEAVGRSNFRLVVPPDRLAESLDRVGRIRLGERLAPLETVRLRKCGEPVRVSVTVSAVRVAGRVVGLAAMYRDDTERGRLEEQLRQAQKLEAVGRLAGGVAHDFNNLLTIISGYSELMLASLAAGDQNRSLVKEIYDAGERAAQLTRQLLTFSRKQVVEARLIDLNEVVAKAEKMLRRLIGEDVRLVAKLGAGLRRVKADPGQVEQVIVNLAVNARDAMPTGGLLAIETADADLDEADAARRAGVPPGRYVRMAVSDTGRGMTDEVLARAFEPFFTTKGADKGTGLGLATVFGIVKQSGGHVCLTSEVGRGTTFRVYLPAVEDAAGPPLVGSQATVPTGTETVLLAEDDARVRDMARAALRSFGYAVLEARDGEEAVRVAAAYPGPIDLLITDVVMPGMGGRQVAEELARRRPGLRVLYVSGYTDDAVIRHGVLHAETAFLQKPFTMAALANKVRRVLSGREPAPATT